MVSRRPLPDRGWGRLVPAQGLQWVDLVEDEDPAGLCVLYALLDAGLLEAWQDRRGHVRFRRAAGAATGTAA